jgi:hypothetical protein
MIGTSPRRTVRWVSLCVVAGSAIDASNGDLDALLVRAWRFPEIVLLSLPAIVGRAVPMRRGPATDRAGDSLRSRGAAAVSWRAFVVAFACPFADTRRSRTDAFICFALSEGYRRVAADRAEG